MSIGTEPAPSASRRGGGIPWLKVVTLILLFSIGGQLLRCTWRVVYAQDEVYSAAGSRRNSDLAKLLLLGADPDAGVGDADQVPLHAAAVTANREGIRILLRAGANPCARDLQGNDLLVGVEDAEVKRLLIEAMKERGCGPISGRRP